MQINAIKYGKVLNKLLVKYHLAPNHPFKLRIIRILEKLIGVKRLIVDTKFNFRFSVDKVDLIQRSILEKKEWESELSKYLNLNLNSNDVFYDIGANVGYFSCLALSRNIKHLVAFEPDPLNAEIIDFNFRLNNYRSIKYSIVNIALGDKNSIELFYRSNTANTGISGLIKNYEEYESQFEVEVKSLDFLISNGLSLPTIMKIDTEGYELNILKGGANLLRENPPRVIIFEANKEVNFQNIKTYLMIYGYVSFEELKDDHGINYIATLSL